MATNILFVRVTCGVLADEVVGGLDSMAYLLLCKVREGRLKVAVEHTKYKQ